MRAMLLTMFLASVMGCGQPLTNDFGNWKEFSFEEGKCSVRLATEPTKGTLVVESGFGQQTVTYHRVGGGRLSFGVTYGDFPKSVLEEHSTDAILEVSMAGTVKGFPGGRLLTKENITIGVFPGRAFRVEVDNAGTMLHQRTYLVGERLYTVIAVAPKNSAASGNVAKFLDSFSLHPK